MSEAEFAAHFARLGPHEEHPWEPMPWSGVWNKVLFSDPITGFTIELARVEKGAAFPPHYHTTMQTLFLISGRLRSNDRVIEAGTFNVIPAGELHGPFEAEEEAIQFKVFSSLPVYILTDGTTHIYKRDGRTISAGELSFADSLDGANFIQE
jgi:quercetin dioxygenase-like cupin family protein